MELEFNWVDLVVLTVLTIFVYFGKSSLTPSINAGKITEISVIKITVMVNKKTINETNPCFFWF